MRNTVFSLLLACSLALPACQKPYAFERPIGLTSRDIRLAQYADSTHVVVYSSGIWDAHLTGSTPWASLKILKNDGIGDMLFSFDENKGITRRAGIRITCGAQCDTVMFTQSGPNVNPQLAFADEIVTATGLGGEISLVLNSNVMDSKEMIYPSVMYYVYGEPGPKVAIDGTGWIRSYRIDSNRLYLDLADNSTGERRSADVFLRLNNDWDIDFTVSVRLRQNAQ